MILFAGAIAGFAVGLLAAGGGQLAVPLLVWGAGMPAHQAVFVSLVTVGAVSLVGAIASLRRREVSLPVGLLVGAGAALASPIGVRLGHLLPEQVLLGSLAALIGLAGLLMWRRAMVPLPAVPTVARSIPAPLLLAGGLFVGLLIGIFGIAGGFIMVPLFVLAGGLPMRPAIGSALLASAIGCGAGVVAQVASGNTLPLGPTAIFLMGAVAGLAGGRLAGRRIAPTTLQRLFAVILLIVAILMIGRIVVTVAVAPAPIA